MADSPHLRAALEASQAETAGVRAKLQAAVRQQQSTEIETWSVVTHTRCHSTTRVMAITIALIIMMLAGC
jgi:hypothetical protein